MIGIPILIGTNLCIFLFLLLFFKKRIDKALQTETLLRQVREEVNQMVIELNQTTNRNISLLEERINRLTELLGKADKCIVLMNREVSKHEKGVGTYQTMKPKAIPVPQRETKKEERPVRQRVIDLYRQGISSGMIASQLDMTVGEVDLIISLEERKR